MTYTHNKNSGFTLIETLVYTVLMVLVIGVISSILYHAYTWYGSISVSSRVDQVGATIIDRISKDIRSGESVNISQSSFDTASGILSINELVDPDTTVIRKYWLQNDQLAFREDSGAVQYLSPREYVVSQFRLYNLISPVSDAVRFTISISYATKNGTTTNNYTGLAILRNSYQ